MKKQKEGDFGGYFEELGSKMRHATDKSGALRQVARSQSQCAANPSSASGFL